MYGYGVKFDGRLNFPINDEWGKNVIIYGVDNSLSVLTNNRKKYPSS